LLLDVETILLGVVVLFFGWRYAAGWKTHVQRIVVGLATASLSQITMQAVWEWIARSAKPQSMAEYQHFMSMREHMFNANSVVYLLVLVWWIACMWKNEPGQQSTPLPENTPQPEQA
jgi:hypothetical protein